MEKIRRVVNDFNTRPWRVPPRSVVLLLMLLVAIGMRLSYFFMSNDIRMWRYEMLYHDEALFLMQGRDVLNGKLPYIGHWDNRPAFGWMLFAVLNFLSGENLVAFRAIGALYIGLTGYVLYRTLADSQKAMSGVLAGLFYIVFCSVAQVGQSITYEHVVALPFSMMMYVLVNPHHMRRPRACVAALFTMCVMTLTNFLVLGPAIAVLMPARTGRNVVAVPPIYTRFRPWLAGIGRWLLEVMRGGLVLFAGLVVGYGLLYTLYWINGQHEFLVRSMIDGAFAVSRQPMDERLLTQFATRWTGFSHRFLNSYIYSNEWLIPFMLTVFMCRTASTLFEQRRRCDPVLIKIGALLCFGALALFFRGGNFWNFPYYLLQLMPLVALAMGCAGAFRMGDVRILMLVVMVWGVSDASRMVLNNYKPLIAFMRGNERFSGSYLNDRQYQIAHELNKFPIAGEEMIVCNEDDMLYILTHAENPRYYLFPAFQTFYYLSRVLQVDVPPLGDTIKEKKPMAIVGWRGDGCFNQMGETMRDYDLFASVQNTMIYIRRDVLKQVLPAADAVTPVEETPAVEEIPAEPVAEVMPAPAP